MGGRIAIYSNPNLASMDGTFAQLQSVGDDLNIYWNQNLASIDGSFPNLQTIDRHLSIHGNPLLSSIGSSFSSIHSVGGTLNWYRNGGQPRPVGPLYLEVESTAGSVSFCASAVGTLCPTTTNYDQQGGGEYADDAEDCCDAYCATTTDC